MLNEDERETRIKCVELKKHMDELAKIKHKIEIKDTDDLHPQIMELRAQTEQLS